MTQDSKFLVTIGGNPPTIMCEKHAQMFEKIMTLANIPHTIYEMEDDETDKKCHACNLTTDIIDNTPRIILPN